MAFCCGSVIQRVRRQLDMETLAGETTRHERHHTFKKDNLQEGTLVWIAPAKALPHDKKNTFRLSRGEKSPLTLKEAQLFSNTPYARGFSEYIYEGQLRRIREMEDRTDPRSAVRQGYGLFCYPNGVYYEGKWHRGKRQGTGCIASFKGYKYTGEWCDDVQEGNGCEVFACRAVIDTHYANGLPQGEGVVMYNPKQNAYRYEGGWQNGKRHGRGVIFYANGDTFDCSFEQGRRHGRGVTTQTVNGKEIQYETQWRDDKLVSIPRLIPKALRTKKPVSSIPFRTTGYLLPADLINWTVQQGTQDLSFEHFMQLKLGFESLDVVGRGFLSMKELRALWPESNMDMLRKFDSDGKESVELFDIICAWYPRVLPHDIARMLQEFISPFDLFRLRGFLNGIDNADGMGYYHICGDASPATGMEGHRPALHLRELETAGYRIGGEKFTAANYSAACQLHDPPHFVDVLVVWYPNVLRVVLEQYEMEEVANDILDAIRVDFNRYAHLSTDSGKYLLIEEFVQAEAAYRVQLCAAYMSNERTRGAMHPTCSALSTVECTSSSRSAIETDMRPGFLKGASVWILANRIRLNVPLLLEIERFHVRQKGRVTLDELLRFCFPSVPCLYTRQAILGSFSETHCSCILCNAAMR
ncbi:putative phosphatidylinositol-4-phosphate 5-kinase [Trypanosoma rangeli]|uniref:Putative phosphatidylinositol-4-phosphate 5-kinase n=1 Tax=Trypanosoma rangeli TaxID=5698 RepID=A0A422P1C5_TRYRA|nr:putative phosphatidylinositol-4-phosphate 5-kinase [Trypanosoma rangeli]RNF11530.1 putative phosphatidylinositol-4-phosphate 5-kinase [Trypanosoma rangeli]|eukprot:RNF11530.1 putative phosphatidylinositol-4-phosphate 5-kinase [Trypanosoma rangeli]